MYRYTLHIIQANGRALIDAMQLPALVGITRHGHLQETRAQDMPDGPLVQSKKLCKTPRCARLQAGTARGFARASFTYGH